jgi:hypothetical protein
MCDVLQVSRSGLSYRLQMSLSLYRLGTLFLFLCFAAVQSQAYLAVSAECDRGHKPSAC